MKKKIIKNYVGKFVGKIDLESVFEDFVRSENGRFAKEGDVIYLDFGHIGIQKYMFDGVEWILIMDSTRD